MTIIKLAGEFFDSSKRIKLKNLSLLKVEVIHKIGAPKWENLKPKEKLMISESTFNKIEHLHTDGNVSVKRISSFDWNPMKNNLHVKYQIPDWRTNFETMLQTEFIYCCDDILSIDLFS